MVKQDTCREILDDNIMQYYYQHYARSINGVRYPADFLMLRDPATTPLLARDHSLRLDVTGVTERTPVKCAVGTRVF